MNTVTKKIIVCLVINQLLKALPESKTKLAGILGQDAESLEIDVLPETLTVAGIAIVWQALSSVIDWRILVAATVVVVAIYYITNRVDEDSDILSEAQLDNVSKKLLN